MDLQEIDLKKLISESKSAFPHSKPSLSELQRAITPTVVAMGFGIAEAIALAAFLLALWSRLYPKTDPSIPKCKKMHNGRLCGQQFISVSDDGKFITMWCARKHRTKLRI